MINDHRPYWMKRIHRVLERRYTEHFVAPGFESLGSGHQMMKPWNVLTYGRHIRAGDNLHVISDSHRKVSFSSWAFDEHQGHITLGDNVLVGINATVMDGAVIGSGASRTTRVSLAPTYTADTGWKAGP